MVYMYGIYNEYTLYEVYIFKEYTMYIHDIYLDTQLISCLAPGELDEQGAPGTKNSLEVPCLIGKTYKLIFLDISHSHFRSSPKDKDNQTNS